MKSAMLVVLFFVALCVSAAEDPHEAAEIMLSKMTTEEKLGMMHGHKGVYVGNIYGVERLGIPPLYLHDGPQGFRVTNSTGVAGSTTAWPGSLTVAASWDTDLAYRWASAIATEFKGKGANVMLGPGLGVARVPNAGRNFEYLSGEDPLLGSVMGAKVVEGIQSQGVMANAKHWVNNEIEDDRNFVSANVDERTRFELYYPPFQGAVDAGVLTAMCSYNRINDVHACENNETIGDLKNALGFDGFIMSDWFATHSTAGSVNAGLDMEMPVGFQYTDSKLQSALKEGTISMDAIDASVTRILTAMYSIGMFDEANRFDAVASPESNVTSVQHNYLSREVAAKSTVLLKNENGVLPMLLEEVACYYKCIAVIGDNSTVSGMGSGHVTPAYVITQQDGIEAMLHQQSRTVTAQVLYNNGVDVAEAVALAEQCEVTVVVVATTSKEGSDRPTLSLGSAQDTLITSLAAVNTSLIVSVIAPGPVLMPWEDDVSTILYHGLPGQESGNALADVLFGHVNPSARLPVTIPNKDNEVGFVAEQYPGVGSPPEATYLEGLLIGHRWYDVNEVSPRFAFGHGLSYASFKYGDVDVHASGDGGGFHVSLSVTNIGRYTGAEVVQLYLTFPSSAGEPLRQLKGFWKTPELQHGYSIQAEFHLSDRDLSIWNTATRSWLGVKGGFEVHVGASSVDIRQTAHFEVV